MTNKRSPVAKIFKNAMEANPVLVQVIGLCPVVAATASLQAALLFSAVTLVALIISEILASVALKNVPPVVRNVIYLAIGTGISCPILYYFDRMDNSLMNLAGIYLPLLSINSLTALHCEKYAVKRNVTNSFYNALSAGIGYALVLVLCGTVRELLGRGTLWGKTVTVHTVPGILLPFGGFLVLGFLAALLKAVLLMTNPAAAKRMEFLNLKKKPAPVKEVKPQVSQPAEQATIKEESAVESTQEITEETPEAEEEIPVEEPTPQETVEEPAAEEIAEEAPVEELTEEQETAAREAEAESAEEEAVVETEETPAEETEEKQEEEKTSEESHEPLQPEYEKFLDDLFGDMDDTQEDKA